MNTELINRRKQLEKDRDQCLMQAHNLKLKAERIAEELISIAAVIDERELIVTNHAFDRFRERVMHLPEKKIRQILTAKDLTEAHRKKGNGRFGIRELPHVVVQIRDFAIVTVINTLDPEERLKMLGEYMNYYIDEIALKYTGHEVKIMKMKTFKHLYYRHQP